MLFNSVEYIFAFLPVALIIYFLLTRRNLYSYARSWLVLASLFFYGWWNPVYLPLILLSITGNYLAGSFIGRAQQNAKHILTAGIIFNIALLGFFKYTDFFIENMDWLLGLHLEKPGIVLPLGISFFTFTQIAYLADIYKDKAKGYGYRDYSLFVTFFPHLLAGPILHHKEMMPQFLDVKNKAINLENFSMGLFLFFIGLFKKVEVADVFAVTANAGFDQSSVLTFFEAWATSLSYTFQIYFDFSGYTDMALGAALMFNIRLPFNFNSPYKATDIQDFWKRWHMTLSRFLRDYVYIPLGGNRAREMRTYENLFITFLIGGLWHGAGWTFIFWGFLHGAAIVLHRAWQKYGFRLNSVIAWFVTFNFVNIAWIFFRARTWDDAVKVLRGMFDLNQAVLPSLLLEVVPPLKFFFGSVESLRFMGGGGMGGGLIGFMEVTLYIVFGFTLTLAFKNTNKLTYRELFIIFILVFTFSLRTVIFAQGQPEFIYFRF